MSNILFNNTEGTKTFDDLKDSKRHRFKGLFHRAYYEEMPTFEKAGCEFVYPDINYPASTGSFDGGEQKLNCQIVFGRDRPSHLLSGYGKIAGPPCASIDIVAGRMSSLTNKKGFFAKKLEPVTRDSLVGNNFFTDASRIYVSQKCDIDHYFGLPPGDYGRPRGEAAVAVKSDHVRLIGRESVKIYAGGGRAVNLGIQGELTSNGDPLTSSRIELITNNDKESQPVVLGSNLSKMFDELFNKLSSLEEAFVINNMNVARLQMQVATHFHSGVGVGVILSGPDPILADAMIDMTKRNIQKIQNHVSNALNFQVMKMNYLGLGIGDPKDNISFGTVPILSDSVFVT